MSSLVHMPNPTRISMNLAPKLVPSIQLKPLSSKFGISLCPLEGIEADVISGKEAGAKAAVLAPNQRGVLTLGTIRPLRYQCMLVVNPEFNLLATVQAPLMMEPKEVHTLRLVINAHKEVDLASFAWFCRLYLFE